MTTALEALAKRIKLHVWSLTEAYDGDLDVLAAVSCDHDNHVDESEKKACLLAVILHDFLVSRANRDAALAAIVEVQKAG